MNFVDTAITLLQESGKPMAAEELCEMAIERDLLDKPGANPLRSMKTRLTVELKKGASSRVQKTEDESWMLSEAEPAKASPKKKTARKAKSATKAKAEPKAAKKTKAAPKAKAAAASKGKAATKSKTAAKTKSKDAEPEAEKATKKKRTTKSKKAEADAAPEAPEVVEPPVVLTEEEKALVDLYSDDSGGTRSAAELNEYQDSLTKDEDRLMLPEIKAERKPYRQNRDKDRTRQRRSRRGREPREPRERTSRDSEMRQNPPGITAQPSPLRAAKTRSTNGRGTSDAPSQIGVVESCTASCTT